mmetsp:Transcript_4786/g.9601  ORF Transcript_4786/g.9601 Transcript_4786/m.9601 type:complete len:262 (-) Transcript_4786:951-1736(-)
MESALALRMKLVAVCAKRDISVPLVLRRLVSSPVEVANTIALPARLTSSAFKQVTTAHRLNHRPSSGKLTAPRLLLGGRRWKRASLGRPRRHVILATIARATDFVGLALRLERTAKYQCSPTALALTGARLVRTARHLAQHRFCAQQAAGEEPKGFSRVSAVDCATKVTTVRSEARLLLKQRARLEDMEPTKASRRPPAPGTVTLKAPASQLYVLVVITAPLHLQSPRALSAVVLTSSAPLALPLRLLLAPGTTLLGTFPC